MFVTLRRHHQEISYYKTRNGREVDFIVPRRRARPLLVQVCESLIDTATRRRESVPFSATKWYNATIVLMRTITQRELRNESAAILRDVQTEAEYHCNLERNSGRGVEAGVAAQVRVQGRCRRSRANHAAHRCGALSSRSGGGGRSVRQCLKRCLAACSIPRWSSTSTTRCCPTWTVISAITVAELAAARNATQDELERARRQHRLPWVVVRRDPLPFDGDVHVHTAGLCRDEGQRELGTPPIRGSADRSHRVGAFACPVHPQSR